MLTDPFFLCLPAISTMPITVPVCPFKLLAALKDLNSQLTYSFKRPTKILLALFAQCIRTHFMGKPSQKVTLSFRWSSLILYNLLAS